MNSNTITALLTMAILMSCNQKQKVDLVLYNGTIYTVDSTFSKVDAMVVDQGQVVETGTYPLLSKKYLAKQERDLKGAFVYPGFYDAHCHFLGFGLSLRHADLSGTSSFEEVMDRLLRHRQNHPSEWLLGRGWDQNDWEVKTFPNKTMLDEKFPDIPVYLTRIDGHAGVANSRALELAKIKPSTKVKGGEILLDSKGTTTGVLLDNAMQLIDEVLPGIDEKSKREALLEAQEKCFSVGLTSVADAGLSASEVGLIDQLQKDSLLQMRIYAMLNPTKENVDKYISGGRKQTPSLTISSIKLYADGALGSRGALMQDDYTDDPGNKGIMVQSEDYYRKWCEIAHSNGFQVNIHCIGDSANRIILDIYSEFLKEKNDRRWRIEHAQIIHPDDLKKFGMYSIIPSVQPTHATSDMYWADERLGAERLKTGYIYQTLLQQNGWLPHGSDFPVESINPLLGFYAAVARQDVKGYPERGFQSEEALTREQALRAMTVWAARAGFEEHTKGSLEPGKLADFVILDEDLMSMDIHSIPLAKVKETFINGNPVFINDALPGYNEPL